MITWFQLCQSTQLTEQAMQIESTVLESGEVVSATVSKERVRGVKTRGQARKALAEIAENVVALHAITSQKERVIKALKAADFTDAEIVVEAKKSSLREKNLIESNKHLCLSLINAIAKQFDAVKELDGIKIVQPTQDMCA